jgi:undecaprenyl-diphosphatase
MDARLFLDVNRFAQHTHWLNGFMRLYAEYLWLIGIGFVLAVVLVSIRRSDAGARSEQWVLFGWTLASMAVAAGVVELCLHLIARPAPYVAISDVQVLVRGGAQSMPDLDTALVAAVFLGLLIARRWLLGGATLLLGALAGYSHVYVGSSYPGDVLAGAGFGATVAGLTFFLTRIVLDNLGQGLETRAGATSLVQHVPSAFANQPAEFGASGSVKVLSDAAVRPVPVGRLNGGTGGHMPSS